MTEPAFEASPVGPGPAFEGVGTGPVEDLLADFESEWFRGERPAIDDFVARIEPECQLALCLELVHTELELRLKAGEDARVEAYLARYPSLRDHPEWIHQLLHTEHRYRCKAPLSLEEIRS